MSSFFIVVIHLCGAKITQKNESAKKTSINFLFMRKPFLCLVQNKGIRVNLIQEKTWGKVWICGGNFVILHCFFNKEPMNAEEYCQKPFTLHFFSVSR